MDSASEELYFQKIQELIQDEDKIVTVSSLASSLHISVQNSRKLLSKYVEDQRKLNPNELAVTYVISGTLKQNGKKAVIMVMESDLPEKRKLFDTDPLEVIYSVQKSKNVDFNIVALVDMFNSNNIRDTALEGSIVSKNCIKREIRTKKLPSPPPPTLKGKSIFFAPKTEANTSKKVDSSPKSEQKVKNSNGIADMFKSAVVKSKTVNNSTAKSNKPNGKSGGLTGFLTNGNTKSKEKNDIIKTETNSSVSDSQSSFNEAETVELMDTDEDDVKKDKIKSSINENHKKPNTVKEKPKANKRQRDKSKEMPSKRRKRIIEKNDSDSDDMFEKEDEDIIEGSDEEPETISPPVVQKPTLPKNKRRKAVTRTYEDEEGFIVTKTEYVYETASEDENVEPEPQKQEKKETSNNFKVKSAEKKKLPAKNQATLMNFFKKV